MKTETEIINCFIDRGMDIDLGANFSVKGQVAQLLDGVKDVIEVCEWNGQSCDTEGTYDTSCGGLFSITEGTVEENDFKYCPYCGGEIKAYEADYSDL